MKRFITVIFLIFSINIKAGGIPVIDAVRHVTDIIDNIQDIIDQVNQIKNQIEQIKKLTEQIEQMDDYLDRVGHAAKIAVKTEKLLNGDINDILSEIDEYIYGEGLTKEEKEENTELFGDIDKEEHLRLEEPLPEKQYDKHERVEKEFAAYKKASDSISLKRLGILDHLQELGSLLNSAGTDREVQKINSSINAHKLMLSALKDEEERQYRSYTSELNRNKNALEKEITRFGERAKLLDLNNRNRQARYIITKSTDILKLIEAGKCVVSNNSVIHFGKACACLHLPF